MLRPRGAHFAAPVALVLAAVLAGCGSTKSGTAGAQPGSAVFTSAGCGSCHTLRAAGAHGFVGPNLDETKPSRKVVIDSVTNGRSGMPSYGDRLSRRQIEELADFVAGPAR